MLSRLETRPVEALQRVAAEGRLGVRHADGRTRIVSLVQEGAAKIRMPKTESGPLEAVLINTAGGLTGGDRIAWEIEVGEGAAATVTTQACEKIYRASSGTAEVECRLAVRPGARLAWLPQETIVFDRSAFARRLNADLAPRAETLIVEATVFGRLSMGERTRTASFRDRWRIRQGGKLVHAEDFAVGPDVAATLERRAATGGDHAMATVLLVAADAQSRLSQVRKIIGERGAASAWSVAGSGKLLARLTAKDSYSLRSTLVPLIELLNGQAGLPKVWSL